MFFQITLSPSSVCRQRVKSCRYFCFRAWVWGLETTFEFIRARFRGCVEMVTASARHFDLPSAMIQLGFQGTPPTEGATMSTLRPPQYPMQSHRLHVACCNLSNTETFIKNGEWQLQRLQAVVLFSSFRIPQTDTNHDSLLIDRIFTRFSAKSMPSSMLRPTGRSCDNSNVQT